jgi:inhibitor of cysteine peptidase
MIAPMAEARQGRVARRRWVLAVSFGVAGAAVPWSDAGARALDVGEGDDGRRLSARVGDTIEVRLRENPSTGYRWEVDRLDEKLLRLLEKTTSGPTTPMPGAGGGAIFRFAVVGTGSGALSLKLWRPWEGDPSIVQRLAVRIDAVS